MSSPQAQQLFWEKNISAQIARLADQAMETVDLTKLDFGSRISRTWVGQLRELRAEAVAETVFRSVGVSAPKDSFRQYLNFEKTLFDNSVNDVRPDSVRHTTAYDNASIGAAPTRLAFASFNDTFTELHGPDQSRELGQIKDFGLWVIGHAREEQAKQVRA